MTVKFTSRLPEFKGAMDSAQRAGLLACAHLLRNAVMAKLQDGYTSGDFVTGQSLQHVAIGEITVENGGLTIRVGTDLLYNLYWELGHFNLFTRKYERVEYWREAFEENQEAMAELYQKVVQAHIRQRMR